MKDRFVEKFLVTARIDSNNLTSVADWNGQKNITSYTSKSDRFFRDRSPQQERMLRNLLRIYEQESHEQMARRV